jgi:hypothetical protein
MAQRIKWDPERIKVAIEAIRNWEMGSYKASRVSTVPQTTLERYVNPYPANVENRVSS